MDLAVNPVTIFGNNMLLYETRRDSPYGPLGILGIYGPTLLRELTCLTSSNRPVQHDPKVTS